MDLQAERTLKQEPIPPQEAAMMRGLLRRIGRKNPVRQAAEAFLEGATPAPQTTELLLKSLKTPKPYHWRRQVVASWMLGYGQWQTGDTEAAEKRLIEIVDRWALRNVNFRLLRVLGVCGLFCALYFISFFTSGHPEPGWVFFFIILGSLFGTTFSAFLMWPFFALMENGKLTRIRASAITSLGRLHSVEALPALSHACLEGPDSSLLRLCPRARNIRTLALTAMEQILPCVTDYDYARLAVGIPTLCRALEKLATKPQTESHSSERVALLLLSALGKVGDGRATVIVERVSQKAFSAYVRAAAAGVLPLLQDRRQQENAANTLLRGAAPNMAGQETLLRAATPTDHTNPNQLLRPTRPQTLQPLTETELLEPQEPTQTSAIEPDRERIYEHENPAPETLVQQTSGQA